MKKEQQSTNIEEGKMIEQITTQKSLSEIRLHPARKARIAIEATEAGDDLHKLESVAKANALDVSQLIALKEFVLANIDSIVSVSSTSNQEFIDLPADTKLRIAVSAYLTGQNKRLANDYNLTSYQVGALANSLDKFLKEHFARNE